MESADKGISEGRNKDEDHEKAREFGSPQGLGRTPSHSPASKCEMKLKILRREYRKLQQEFDELKQEMAQRSNEKTSWATEEQQSVISSNSPNQDKLSDKDKIEESNADVDTEERSIVNAGRNSSEETISTGKNEKFNDNNPDTIKVDAVSQTYPPSTVSGQSVGIQAGSMKAEMEGTDLVSKIALMQKDRDVLESQYNSCQEKNEKMRQRLYDTEGVLAEMSEKLQNVSVELYETQQLGARTRPVAFEASDRQFCSLYGLPETEYPVHIFPCFDEKGNEGVLNLTPNYLTFGGSPYQNDGEGGVLGMVTSKFAAIGDIIKRKNSIVLPWQIVNKIKGKKFGTFRPSSDKRGSNLGIEVSVSCHHQSFAFSGFQDRDEVLKATELFTNRFSGIKLG